MEDSIMDQMTRLRLKLLEKRLENERDNYEERTETALSTRDFDGREDALHRALRRKKDLLQKLKEQRMLEDLGRPHTWGGSRKAYGQHTLPVPPPIHFYSPATLPAIQPAPPQPPRILQQMMPQQPTTIIQQLPQQQPLIAQVPPPQQFQPNRSGSIKEDMVELMLMQNAQMHQIIMHNMMLKALPPMAPSPAGHPTSALHNSFHPNQDSFFGSPFILKSERPKGSGIHHHHHYSLSAGHLPSIGYPPWPSVWSSNSAAQEGSFQHMTGPMTLPPLNAVATGGLSYRDPLGL